MTTSIAEYYREELEDWQRYIDSRIVEIQELEDWLKRIVLFNTVASLAAIVEHYLNQLMLCRQGFGGMLNDISKQEKKLSTGDVPIKNEHVTEDLKAIQQEIRKHIYGIEKEYLDIKFNAEEFLSDAIIKQYKGGNKNTK